MVLSAFTVVPFLLMWLKPGFVSNAVMLVAGGAVMRRKKNAE